MKILKFLVFIGLCSSSILFVSQAQAEVGHRHYTCNNITKDTCTANDVDNPITGSDLNISLKPGGRPNSIYIVVHCALHGDNVASMAFSNTEGDVTCKRSSTYPQHTFVCANNNVIGTRHISVESIKCQS